MPFVSGAILLYQTKYYLVITGILIIITNFIFYSITFGFDKFLIKYFKIKTGLILLNLFYVFSALIYILSIFYFLNKENLGDFWLFIFSWSIAYIPYNYMLQQELYYTGNQNTVTKIINNFVVLGYFAFAITLNFINISDLWGFFILILITSITFNSISNLHNKINL